MRKKGIHHKKDPQTIAEWKWAITARIRVI